MTSKFFCSLRFLILSIMISSIWCVQVSPNYRLHVFDKFIETSNTITSEIRIHRRCASATIDDEIICPRTLEKVVGLRCGNMFAGWNPFGYGITKLGLEFLEWDGSLGSDIGRFLSSFKSGRKREKQLKEQWLEIVRVAKSGQSMRIYRKMDNLLLFCVKAGFLA